MRLSPFLLVAACAPHVTAAPVPEPAPAAAPAEALAPRLFDADGLRAGFVLGTKVRFRIESAGEPAVEMRWEVTGHTDSDCTIHATIHDPATGELLEDQGEEPSTWTELETHGSFPAARTEVVDSTVTVPGGTFATVQYTVRDEDGSVKVLHFAKSLPGPPVSMVVTKDGQQLMSMTLLERTQP